MTDGLPGSLLELSEPAKGFHGITIGIVTNTQDPDGLGQVQVRLPLMPGEDITSYWAAVLTPMAGKGRGLYCLPEVGDEVLVAFLHGEVEMPYILGSVWNGADKPPESNQDGKNNKRLFKSRSGHQIILDDTDGEEKIIIQDKTAKNALIFNSKENSLTIIAEKNISLTAKGDLKLESTGAMTLKAGGDLTLTCKNLAMKPKAKGSIEATQDLALKGRLGVKVEGLEVTITGQPRVNINNGHLEVM